MCLHCVNGGICCGESAREKLTHKTHGSLKSVLITFRADATSVLKAITCQFKLKHLKRCDTK